jgi:hypothetical protein
MTRKALLLGCLFASLFFGVTLCFATFEVKVDEPYNEAATQAPPPAATHKTVAIKSSATHHKATAAKTKAAKKTKKTKKIKLAKPTPTASENPTEETSQALSTSDATAPVASTTTQPISLKKKSPAKSKGAISKLTLPVKSSPVASPKAARVSFSAQEGSLLSNIQRFADQFHYRLIWNVLDPSQEGKIDFAWVGNLTLEKSDPVAILRELLNSYPVTVKVWTLNNVVCVTNTGSCYWGDAHAL